MKIAKRQTEIVTSENGQYHGQQNETNNKRDTQDPTMKTKTGITRILQKQGCIQINY